MLKIPRAFINNNCSFTPEEWENDSNDEIRNRTSKGEFSLTCEIGCKLYFRPKTEIRRSHFVHYNPCDLVDKYTSCPGGVETDIHFQAKHAVGNIKKFSLRCYKCGEEVESLDIDPKWKYKTEVRIGKYLVDGAFLDHNEQPVLIVEVYGTHQTKGEKRKWFIDNAYRYIEVPASDPTRVIDHWERVLECNAILKYSKNKIFYDENLYLRLQRNPKNAKILTPGCKFVRPYDNNRLYAVDDDGISYGELTYCF